jgi:hypothetical protein
VPRRSTEGWLWHKPPLLVMNRFANNTLIKVLQITNNLSYAVEMRFTFESLRKYNESTNLGRLINFGNPKWLLRELWQSYPITVSAFGDAAQPCNECNYSKLVMLKILLCEVTFGVEASFQMASSKGTKRWSRQFCMHTRRLNITENFKLALIASR